MWSARNGSFLLTYFPAGSEVPSPVIKFAAELQRLDPVYSIIKDTFLFFSRFTNKFR